MLIVYSKYYIRHVYILQSNLSYTEIYIYLYIYIGKREKGSCLEIRFFDIEKVDWDIVWMIDILVNERTTCNYSICCSIKVVTD